MSRLAYDLAMGEPVSMIEAVAQGDRALARGAWETARSWFESALEGGEHPAALEGLSWTHWWQENLDACLAVRERAFRGYRDAGDQRGMARMALWIGDDHLWYRGAPAVADGWLARARRLLDELAECPEHGWLAVFDAHVALGSGNIDRARWLADEAQRIGRSHGSVDLEMFGVATDGVARLEAGELTEGLRCLDEAAAAALAGEYEHLAPATWSCCLLLTACEELHDDERGAQWCDQIIGFSRRIGAQFVVGNCRSHYGSLLARCGRWEDAERELDAAVRGLQHGPAPWRCDALARLGDLRRRQGRHVDATDAFEQAGEHLVAQAGLAALCLDAGDIHGAADLAQRALRHASPGSPRRAEALSLAVQTRLALGDLDAAAGYAAELQDIAATVATRPLQAAARLNEARLAAAGRDVETAAVRYESAVAAFERAGVPLEAAQARLELARTLATGSPGSRPQRAEAEARRAHAVLGELGADAEAARANVLIDELRAHQGGTGEPSPLTSRQVEILRLAAEGLTEHQIATRLVLSEHTVHRHLANAYSRLGCSSRAAAVTRASRLGLL